MESCFDLHRLHTMDDPYSSVMRYDVGYRELVPGVWFPTKPMPGAWYTWSERSIAEATRVEMLESDILLVSFPKSGEESTARWTRSIIHQSEVLRFCCTDPSTCVQYHSRSPIPLFGQVLIWCPTTTNSRTHHAHAVLWCE